MKSSDNSKVFIVGAGLAGLCCGRRLAEAGVPFEILEESDAVGGRVRTDRVRGFRLDRGFQVLLTAYPEARKVLDYEALNFQKFYPGALVFRHGTLHRLADPFREPMDACKNLFNGVGSLADKVRVARFRRRALAGSLEDVFRRPETTAAEALRRMGFSRGMIDGFFRPFFGGIFLDRDLATSSRQMEFVFRMFACGDTAVPAAGMQAIPEQIAAKLPEGSVRTGTGVRSIEPGALVLASGERRTARAVVVATDPWRAASLAGEGYEPPAFRSTACLYFSTDEPPIDEPILVLDGEGKGPVNNLVEMSAVAPSYAPPRTALIAASVVDPAAVEDPDLEHHVLHQLERWFGPEVRPGSTSAPTASATPSPTSAPPPSPIPTKPSACARGSISRMTSARTGRSREPWWPGGGRRRR